MTFLYSSLGILIMSGVLLISKHSLIFANKNYNFNFYESVYLGSRYQMIDKFILKTLNSEEFELVQDLDICTNILIRYKESNLQKANEVNYINLGLTSSNHNDLINSCVLSNGEHRILIKMRSINPSKYSLNSCIIKKNPICKFEEKI